jgi:hypothetical protein
MPVQDVELVLRHGVNELPRPENRRFWHLSALRAHTKAPYKMYFHRKTLRALNRPKAVRTVLMRATE